MPRLPRLAGLWRSAELVPAFFVSLLAGAWVDRMRRRPIMIAADLARAVVLGTIPLAALCSLLNVIFDVARHAYLPTLLRREELIPGNSRVAASEAVVEFSASGIGGDSSRG